MIRRVIAWASLMAVPATFLVVRHIRQVKLVPQPRGIVLGLYAGVPDYDYRHELDRIAASGATCVSLQAIYRMDTGHADEIRPHPTSSPSDEALLRTFHEARIRGLRIMFFPTINIKDEADNAKWWRGNIAPDHWDTWWANYTAFNVHLAALAQQGGVEWYSVGTEMATTHPFRDQWCALIQDVRKVYTGKVTYSVNFDAHDSFTFGDCLDVIGMNTYDPIAKYSEYPSRKEIVDEWWWIVEKARVLQARFHRPVMITEVGYPSVAHAHVGPWDFRTDKPADPMLQDELLKGAFSVLRNWSDGAASFYYLYGERLKPGVIPGGPGDRTYAPWGKPAEATLKEYFAEPIWEGQGVPKPEDIRDAMLQTLEAQDRKVRGYEDYALPAWSVQWRKDHPQDAADAAAIVAKEPAPARKVKKGEER
ncbi:MAG: hypothetical protein JST05_06675 [Acidobacteria bacterium]|nr:hypothetical protein [Acidobacteriota bacterium]